MSTLLYSFLSRTIAISFWIGIIFLFLFVPHFMGFFGTQKSIKIFTFPMLLDPQYLAQFEKRTGVKLHIHYYEDNNELLVKMRMGKNHGYDIIFPTDYALELLIKEKLIAKLDKKKLNFCSSLRPEFLDLYCDPNNKFSIPYQWEVYGIGFDKRAFVNTPPATWRLLFDKKMTKRRVGMLNNARETIAIAALYLLGSPELLNANSFERVKKLLLKQKSHVEMYTDLRADYLLASQTCCAVACPSNDVWMQGDENLGFLIPQEGSFISVDHVCIAQSCENPELIYQFINYLYESEVVKHHANKYSFFSAIADVDIKESGRKIMNTVLQNLSRFYFFRDRVQEKLLSELWIALKAE